MKFKCIYSGQVYEFLNEHDIVAMQKHPEYEQVVEEEEQEVKPVVKTKKQSVQTEE